MDTLVAMNHKQSYDPPNNTGPTMQIKVDGPNVDANQPSPRLWRPSDTLKGQLVISSAVNLDFDEIHVLFEGTVRTWITAYLVEDGKIGVQTVERKFLAQAHHLKPTSIYQAHPPPSSFEYTISYYFIIPRWVVSSSSSAIDQCLTLPPSMHEGELYEDRSSGKIYMRASISYAIRAVTQCNDGSGRPAMELKDEREILLMPFTAEKPPLDIGDYPAEFKPVSIGKLNMPGWFGCLLAHMSVVMEEPPPLQYSEHTSRVSSESRLRLALEPVRNVTTFRPQDWICAIELQLLVKTYYSTQPLPKIPSKALLTTLGSVRLRSEQIDLGTHERKIPWQLNVAYGHKVGLPSSSNLTWTADLLLPIECSDSLLPNFCSPLVARLYAVRVQTRFKALRHAPFELEVPVQVVYLAPDGDGDAGQDGQWEFSEPPVPPNFDPFEGLASDTCYTPPPEYLH